ncbi:ribosomal protein 60S [Coemansia reversa NRRL 1564]|uniref:Ribosomal protein 60S n=1 Tax=Coemansia reversa (strain ATCC 12441 / NRRL 1564) TaxID=763665 RepID=A0A2G5B6X2_COERN|nr:ribosomal protein 60S [Coemansia reversa NRRL 1564]|eukprot:PIA14477.1 ribosomal protein 60S [Coemansia reversa NRRL 1564]
MRYIAAYLLLQLANPEAVPSASAIKDVVTAAGVDVDTERIDKLLSVLENKNIEELIAEGKSKLASVPSGGAVAAGGAPAAGGAAPAAEAKAESEAEESDDDMGFGLFD